jgi:hypothetical protein
MTWLTGPTGIWVLLALAGYGLVSILGVVARWAQSLLHPGGPAGFSLAIITRNQEHQIEGFLREVLDLLRQPRRSVGTWEVLLIDLGSTDATPSIAERLAREGHIRLLKLASVEPAVAYEMAHFLSEGKVSLLVDLRGKVDAPSVISRLQAICQ